MIFRNGTESKGKSLYSGMALKDSEKRHPGMALNAREKIHPGMALNE